MLGKVAAAQGDLETASTELRLASHATSSSDVVLRSAGPDLELAADLLRADETGAVIEYLAAMKNVWKRGAVPIDRWISEIEAGGVPDFSKRPHVTLRGGVRFR